MTRDTSKTKIEQLEKIERAAVFAHALLTEMETRGGRTSRRIYEANKALHEALKEYYDTME